ncbi:hypothetical protein COT75_05495 [Candidatus Beckwithbacteria bacterium CG10_big_fil_rev_8_21_14_0_10_34_10]|uniref:Uncharacterized protein n=1 Tax=Candidatus Beckwithbacteria bacterium CG10_big_fil_rev_8_21_14_0_10_34_10 TaxID=1974495 RepID=A0A2H0W7P9_9BACT|nr:MAG: hypothetical protein COT75_05495 [Candidatus Beckwithbacteria bacterium CG10_big_fil_rev_8_21_14_0_10_34_10]
MSHPEVAVHLIQPSETPMEPGVPFINFYEAIYRTDPKNLLGEPGYPMTSISYTGDPNKHDQVREQILAGSYADQLGGPVLVIELTGQDVLAITPESDLEGQARINRLLRQTALFYTNLIVDQLPENEKKQRLKQELEKSEKDKSDSNVIESCTHFAYWTGRSFCFPHTDEDFRARLILIRSEEENPSERLIEALTIHSLG